MKRLLLIVSFASCLSTLGVSCFIDVSVQCLSDDDCANNTVCKDKKCVCSTTSLTKCKDKSSDVTCVDLASNSAFCGSCTNSCKAGFACVNKECVPCDKNKGFIECPSSDGNSQICTDNTSDRTNCGACGKVCEKGAVCEPSDADPLLGECKCPKGQKSCGDGVGCVDTQTDGAHCGGCNQKCDTSKNELCLEGACKPCPDDGKPFSKCDNTCVNTKTDAKHCGGCGKACPDGQACCEGTCTDITKPDNCGKCGNKCPTGGKCAEDMTTKQPACTCTDTALVPCAGTCVDTKTDAKHCGTCDNPCKDKEACVGKTGQCCPQPDGAKAGVCNDKCTDLNTDPDNCGACGTTCGNKVCKGGQCVFCTADADCNPGTDKGLKCQQQACVCGPKCGWVTTSANTDTSKQSEASGMAIAVDEAGNTYVTGWFKGTVQFDPKQAAPSLPNGGNHDLFILKLNSKGAVVWYKAYGGTGNDEGKAIAASKDGSKIYVAGLFSDKIAFGNTTLTSNGSSDGFLLVLDGSGALQDAVQFGSDKADTANALTHDGAGMVLLTGYAHKNAKFGQSTLVKIGAQSAFVAKYDTGKKSFAFAKGLESDGSSGQGIALLKSGSFVVTGNCANEVSLPNNSKICTTGSDMMVLTFDASGDLTNDSLATQGDAEGHAATVDSAGTTPWFAGYFVGGGVGFGQKAYSSDLLTPFAVSLSAAAFGTVFHGDTSGASGLTPKPTAGGDAFGIGEHGGKIFVAGELLGSAKFGSTTLTAQTANGQYLPDIFYARLDPNSGWELAVAAGGKGRDGARAVAMDKNGGLYITGFFADTVPNFKGSNGDVSVTAVSTKELFVWKVPQ